MKILVIGLDCATTELLLGDERLENIRRLMEEGCYGALESVVPPSTVPAWMCMATSQDPGSLGVYGFRNRVDHSYDRPRIFDPGSIDPPAIWDQLERQGKNSIIVEVPPGFPPRVVKRSAIDVESRPTRDLAPLKNEIEAMSRTHFAEVRRLSRSADWDYLQCVDIGLNRMQRAFWRYHDPEHVLHEPDSPHRDVIRDYYRALDEEIGSLLQLLDEETLVLVVSAHGARRLDGCFCVNEWLVREGLLVLKHYPNDVTAFNRLEVDWDQTVAWSEAGSCAQIFLNVRGREPRGRIDPRDYERVRDEIKARLEATTAPLGSSPETLVLRPEEVYRSVRPIAPDLIVQYGGPGWRSIDGVGYPGVLVTPNDIEQHDCIPTQHGVFVLAGPNCPLRGPIDGTHLLDIAPTLLELGGHDVPRAMQGRSLAADQLVAARASAHGEPDHEEIVRARLSGLGYL
jgi:predicted AlkP superfamily phosphohydrolase/phosphomutase